MRQFAKFRSEWAVGILPSPVAPALTQARSVKLPANVHNIGHVSCDYRESDSSRPFDSQSKAGNKSCAEWPLLNRHLGQLEDWKSRDVVLKTVPE